MKSTLPTEHDEQVNFVREVRYRFRNDRTFIELLFFSTLNGAWLGGKSFALWAKHEAEGAQRGVSDILYLQSRGVYSFLAIEMKRSNMRNRKDGGLTTKEKEWLACAKESGAFTAVCYSAEESIGVFNRYMGMEVRDL